MRTLNVSKLIVLSAMLTVANFSFAETSTEKYSRELQAKYDKQTKEQERHDARMAAQAEKQLARDIANLKKGDRGLVEGKIDCSPPDFVCGERFLSISVSRKSDDIVYCSLDQDTELELFAKVKEDIVARVGSAINNDCPHVLMSQEEFVRYKRNYQWKRAEKEARKHDNDATLERIKAAREALDAASR